MGKRGLTNWRRGFEPCGAGWGRGGMGRTLCLGSFAPVCGETA